MMDLFTGAIGQLVERDLITLAIPAFLGLMLLEVIVLAVGDDEVNEGRAGYTGRDTATSLSMGVGSLVVGLLVTAAGLGGYLLVWQVRIFDLGAGWIAFAAAIVGYDFMYYWFHRYSHEIRFLWAAHVVHHSSQHYNLSTALRQSWTPLVSWLFYVPIVLLGVNPILLATARAIDLLYQFWIHTEAIDRMWRPIEYVFNTPSHHRVHHGINPQYLDRNYGGILILFDRWFGSFEPEVERPVYGITKQLDSFNPLRVATHEYAAIWRDVRAATTWRDRAGYVLRGPGWQPADRPAAADLVPATD